MKKAISTVLWGLMLILLLPCGEIFADTSSRGSCVVLKQRYDKKNNGELLISHLDPGAGGLAQTFTPRTSYELCKVKVLISTKPGGFSTTVTVGIRNADGTHLYANSSFTTQSNTGDRWYTAEFSDVNVSAGVTYMISVQAPFMKFNRWRLQVEVNGDPYSRGEGKPLGSMGSGNYDYNFRTYKPKDNIYKMRIGGGPIIFNPYGTVAPGEQLAFHTGEGWLILEKDELSASVYLNEATVNVDIGDMFEEVVLGEGGAVLGHRYASPFTIVDVAGQFQPYGWFGEPVGSSSIELYDITRLPQTGMIVWRYVPLGGDPEWWGLVLTQMDLNVSASTFEDIQATATGIGFMDESTSAITLADDAFAAEMDLDLTSTPENPPLPTQLHLLAAMPNPFNPGTTLLMQITEPTDVTLRIYDIAGRMVRELRNDNMQAGRYRIYWDGLNDAGEEISTGVYTVRFTGDNVSESLKVTLIK
ncbi:MAG: T9SS type A sorting domain-containing protein [bacterium]|nr:T9SS type A sorting domain-containing protein [bacterium]